MIVVVILLVILLELAPSPPRRLFSILFIIVAPSSTSRNLLFFAWTFALCILHGLARETSTPSHNATLHAFGVLHRALTYTPKCCKRISDPPRPSASPGFGSNHTLQLTNCPKCKPIRAGAGATADINGSSAPSSFLRPPFFPFWTYSDERISRISFRSSELFGL